MADEILEIGEDGSFEIPTPKAVPPSITLECAATVSESIAENLVFQRINTGEYKIIKEDPNKLNVILCLEDGTYATRFRLNESSLIIEIIDGRKIQIDLPMKILPSKSQAKAFSKYLVIKLEY